MFVNRIHKFISDVRFHPDFMSSDDVLLEKIEIIISSLSQDELVYGNILFCLKKIFDIRWRGPHGIKDSLHDYTFNPRGVNEYWIQLAYELSELKILVHILTILPDNYNNYLNSAILFEGNSQETNQLILINEKGEIEKLMIRNSQQFRKNLADRPALVYSISYERLSRMMACNDVCSQMVSNYLQILMPDVTNVFTLDKTKYLTDSPWLTKLFFLDILPSIREFSYCNQYVFLKSDQQLYFFQESSIPGVLENKILPLDDVSEFINNLQSKRGTESTYIFTRNELRYFVTARTGHLPFELRNFYLGDDDKTLFKLADLDEACHDTKRLFANSEEKSKIRARFVTVKEFFRIRSKTGAYSRRDGMINTWHSFKMFAFRDCLLPQYYLINNEPADKNFRSCIGFKSLEPNCLDYVYTHSNGLVKKGQITTNFSEVGYCLTAEVIRRELPQIVEQLSSQQAPVSLPELPQGEIWNIFLHMLKIYNSKSRATNEHWHRNMFKKNLDDFLFMLSSSSIIDVNYLYAQTIISCGQPILLIDILIDCYIYANQREISTKNDQWGQLVDTHEGVSLDLREKLFSVARWLCLKDASMVIHDPIFLPIYADLEIGPAITVRKLHSLVACLTTTDQLVTRAEIDHLLLKITELLHQESTVISCLFPLIKKLYQLRWERICNIGFEKYNYIRNRTILNAPWVELAKVLSGTVYFEKIKGTQETISYYRFLMPTLKSDVNAVTLTRLEYYPLSYYIFPDGDVSFLVLLSNSEHAVQIGKRFSNVECQQMPFSSLEYQRINAAHARFHRYVPFLGYELELKMPAQTILPNVIYLTLVKGELHYHVLNALSEICTGVLDKDSLDLEYELYPPLKIDQLSPFLLNIVDILVQRGHACMAKREPGIRMSTVLALRQLVNMTLNPAGLQAKDVSSAERTHMELGYEGFSTFYHNLPKSESAALAQQSITNLGGVQTFEELLNFVQKMVPQREDRGCAAVVARGLLKIVMAYIPYAKMNASIESDPNINLSLLRQRTPRKYVVDSHAEAVLNIRNLLISILVYPFNESSGNRVKLWNFSHRVHPEVQLVFKELIKIFNESNYEQARYINSVIMDRLIPELRNQTKLCARNTDSPVFGSHLNDIDDDNIVQRFTEKTCSWVETIAEGKVEETIYFYPPHKLCKFFWDVLRGSSSLDSRWENYFSPEEMEAVMDITLNAYLQDDSHLAKEVRVNIVFNKYLQKMDPMKKGHFFILLNNYMQKPMENPELAQFAYEYLLMRLANYSEIKHIESRLGSRPSQFASLKEMMELLLSKRGCILSLISEKKKRLINEYFEKLTSTTAINPVAEDFFEPGGSSFTWAPLISAMQSYMPNMSSFLKR
jgi:hypothetical protein